MLVVPEHRHFCHTVVTPTATSAYFLSVAALFSDASPRCKILDTRNLGPVQAFPM